MADAIHPEHVHSSHVHENHEHHEKTNEEVTHGHEIVPSSPTMFLGNPTTILEEGKKAPLLRDEQISFFFKGKKDEKTKEIIPGSKRPNVDLVIPVLTYEGVLMKLLEGNDKVKNYIIEQVNAAIREGCKAQVNDEVKPVNRQSELTINELTIEYLAELPASERAGRGISEETWKSFEADYVEVMTEVTQKDPERIKKAAKLFVGKLNSVKENKNVLSFLQQQLALWAGSTKNAEELQAVFNFLDEKLDTLLKKDSADMLAYL